MKTTKKQQQILGRIQKRADFLSVQKAGKKWVARGLVIQIAPNGGLGPRFGLTVTKKVSKSAVLRNRIRRRLRAAAYDVLSLRPASDTDYILIGRIETEKRDYADLCRDIEWCLGKLEG